MPQGGAQKRWLGPVQVNGCTSSKYGKSCCRKHYTNALQKALGPCNSCGRRNRHKSTSDLCLPCFEQTDARKNYHYITNYGITVFEYKRMFEEQQGLCAICKKPPSGNTAVNGRMCVDHDHKTGKVRKLLCFNCNTAIGKLNDDPELFRIAAQYLENERKN